MISDMESQQERRKRLDHERYMRNRDERIVKQHEYYVANRDDILAKVRERQRYAKGEELKCWQNQQR